MFGLTDKILSYVAGAACLVLAIALFFTHGARNKAERRADKAVTELANERTLWADERTRAAEALAVATTKNRETEHQLTAQAEEADHEKQTILASSSAALDSLSRKLRIANSNAATAALVSRTTSDSSAIEAPRLRDGLALPAGVGDGLIGLTWRAETIRLQLATCEKKYDAARDALKR